MFKIGNRVICINNKGMEYGLKLNKSYIITDVTTGTNYIDVNNIAKGGHFNPSRFELDVQYYRKQKLEKICSKLTI